VTREKALKDSPPYSWLLRGNIRRKRRPNDKSVEGLAMTDWISFRVTRSFISNTG